MKITFLKIKLFSYLGCILVLACTALGQSPTASPETAAAEMTPAATVSDTEAATSSVAPAASATLAPSATVAPAVAPTASPDTEEDFDKAIERKINKHLKIAFDGDHSGHDSDGDHWWIPLVVLIGCLTFFGTPVAIVATIMYFSFSRSRALHKTVQMMVEKGQPVPEALLNPPPVVRQRSDLRRGVVLLMVGAGLMVFFGAFIPWEGIWSLGIIPFFVGLGYLLVWRLDVRTKETSPKV